jgi:hypothetical protein
METVMPRRRRPKPIEQTVLPDSLPYATDTLSDYWAELARKAYPEDAELADPLAKDKASIFAALGIVADPWQQALIESNASQTLVLASRQSGKSIASAACALIEALLNPPAEVLIISRALRQSAEVLRKVRDFYYALRGERIRRRRRWQPVSLAPEIEAIRTRGIRDDEVAVADGQLSMELANGSRIISLPGSPDTIVGYSAISLLILDEAARIKDDLYALVRPMLAVGGGRLIALSTPFGWRGWFWAAWSRCEEAMLRGQPEPWRRFRITAGQCPRISAEFLAEERVAIGERWYRQEYETEFCDTVDAIFRSEDIEAMRGSTEKSLMEMCKEADAEWEEINRPKPPVANTGLYIDGILRSDAKPLLDM